MKDNTHIIVGITLDGKKFRPSDWCKRLAGIASTFGPDKRLRYHRYIKPCYIVEHNASGVCVDDRLAEEEPVVYEYVMNFMRSNSLLIIKGRRSERR